MMTLKSLSDQELRVEFSVIKSLQLWVPLGLALYFIPQIVSLPMGFTVVNAALAFLTICLGHCVGLHRQIVHRSYKTPDFMRPVFLLLAALCGFGGPLKWIKFHALRDYWQSQPNAPRAIKYDTGIWADFLVTLHCKVTPRSDFHLSMLPEGLVEDKWVLIFEKAWLPLNLLVAALICFLSSFEVMVYLVALRAGVGLFMHWLVAYIVHVWGHKTYELEGVSEEGRNQLVLGWLTFGEAYHNNHHKFPWSASAGLRRVEFDLGYVVIKALEKIGLAYDLRLSEEHFSKKMN